MQTIQQIAREAFAVNPGFCSKDENAAIELANSMNAIADEGETYEVRPCQGNRFTVAMLYDGKFEMYL